MTISHQEIEIERLKTTVIALNAKCAIVDDHRQDVEHSTNRHAESESKRVDLHTHIKTVVENVDNDNQNHTQYQDELNRKIDDLNAAAAENAKTYD